MLKLKLGRRRAPGPRGHPILTRRRTLPAPTDDGAVLSATATRLLDAAALAEPVRLLGVGAMGLVSAEPDQRELFAAPEPQQRRSRLNRAVDEIQDRFGGGAIARGGFAEAERAGLSQQQKRGE
jgi:DNA polymerase-4